MKSHERQHALNNLTRSVIIVLIIKIRQEGPWVTKPMREGDADHALVHLALET